jgi:hypothetical protein
VHAEAASHLAVGHLSTVKEGVEAAGEVLRTASPLGVVGESPEREDREVIRRDDVGAEPRTP